MTKQDKEYQIDVYDKSGKWLADGVIFTDGSEEDIKAHVEAWAEANKKTTDDLKWEAFE